RPASSSVATFVGRATRVAGRKVDVSGDQVTVAVLGQEFSMPGANLAAETAGAEVDVLFRPEALTIDDAGAITGTVLRRRFTGAADLLTIAIGEVEVEVAATPERVSPGDQVLLTATGSGIHVYPRARSA